MGTRAERLLARAEAARARARAASDAAHRTLDQIPPGQPIITGRGSRTTADRNRRERAWDNVGKAARAADEAQRLERSAERVAAYENRLGAAQAERSLEGVAVGDEVVACFTNSGRYLRFAGVIVGRTINVWKVRSLEAVYPGEEPGRVFHIPVLGRPRSSANNRVYAKE